MLGFVCIVILGVFLGFVGSVLGSCMFLDGFVGFGGFGGFGGDIGFCCWDLGFCGSVIVCVVLVVGTGLDGFENVSAMGLGKLLPIGQVISV